MKEHIYQPFNTFVLRTPLFPYFYLTQIRHSDSVFNEALYLASPEFYKEKLKAGDNIQHSKLLSSIYKYYSRACTRATPFGLFAGCSIGRIGEKTKVILDDFSHYRRSTRLDMNYLCALIQYIELLPKIRNQLRFFTNDSIYTFGDKIRYVEYYYRKTNRIHNIQSVEKTDYLCEILEAAQSGKTIEELSSLLIDGEITLTDATEYICELIDNQLLKSELEPSVTGEDLFSTIISKLELFKGIENVTSHLKKIQLELSEIDKNKMGTTIEHYDKIIDIIKQNSVPFENKYLFQTDMYKPTIFSSVSEKIIGDILDTLDFLIRITPKYNETNLYKFKKSFQERYEEQEVPILKVLDPDSGIGYLQKDNYDINPLINDVFLPPLGVNDNNLSLTQHQIVLLRKYFEILKENKKIIELSDDDFPNSMTNRDDCHSTISVMCQIIKDKGEDRQTYISLAGGSSAANLLGRFSHLDNELFKHARQIADKEQEFNSDSICAEIVHLPESRFGNILARPILRNYEIHYLAKSSVDNSHQIPLSDIALSLRNDKLILRSISRNKKIIPRLTTAHNFSMNSLPIYHFLCDMQNQNIRGGFYLNTSGLTELCNTFPRITYRNVILSRETWFLTEDNVKDFDKLSDEKLLAKTKELQKQKNMPSLITIPSGDNELFIDLNDTLSVRIFSSILIKSKRLIASEFLFCDKDAVITNQEGDSYCGEFLFAFYKNNL